MKPFLVLLRCGPEPAHLDRLEALADAAFDFAVSWAGPVAPLVPGAVFVHVVEGTDGARWPALGQTLAAHADQLSGYSHFWLPEEDIVFDAETVTRLFLICEQLGLELGQPAFQPGSPVSHPVALQHRDFQVRFTNHVDTSAPVLSRSMLAKVLPTLADPALVPEALWPRLSRLGRVAIIDATPVQRSQAPAPIAAADDERVNLGGLLESGDAWCLGPQTVGVDVMLQALMSSCRALKLGAREQTRYLARHLALVDSGAALSITGELDRQLSDAGMCFNRAAAPQAPEAEAPEADPTTARAWALCQADLSDLQARYRAVVLERGAQDELLHRLAEQIGSLAQEVSAPAAVARRIEAV
jgi:hypothetical protein